MKEDARLAKDRKLNNKRMKTFFCHLTANDKF